MRIFAFEQNLIGRVDQRGVVGWKRGLGRCWETVYKSGREVSCILEKRIDWEIESKNYAFDLYTDIEKNFSPRIYSSYRHRKNFLDRFEIYAVFTLIVLFIRDVHQM